MPSCAVRRPVPTGASVIVALALPALLLALLLGRHLQADASDPALAAVVLDALQRGAFEQVEHVGEGVGGHLFEIVVPGPAVEAGAELGRLLLQMGSRMQRSSIQRPSTSCVLAMFYSGAG